ncbi:MAG: 30S ribosomal protein S20 [Patescibacteria group bacterium]
MPIKQAAIKHLRQTKKRTERNQKVRKELKEFIRDIRKAVTLNDKTKLQELSSRLQKLIDKAAQKRIIKKNNASRRKSRLMKQINAVLKPQ